MNNLINLLKINFINAVGLNGLKGKDISKNERIKMLSGLGVILLVIVAVGITVGSYAILLGEALESIGQLDLLLVLGAIATVGLVLMTSIYKAQGVLFSFKDYDLLVSMPIKFSTILTSKVISLLTLNWGFSALMLIPIGVVYGMKVDVGFAFILNLIIGIFFLPLIPIIVASVASFIITYIASRCKNTNIVNFILMLMLVLGVMLCSLKINDFIAYISTKSSSLLEMVKNIYFPGYYFGIGLAENSFKYMGIFILVSIVPFIIFIALLSKHFKGINSKLAEKYKKANYEMKSLNTQSPLKALILKELRGYFSTTIYIFNTSFGMIFLIIGAISSLFMDGEQLVMMMEMPELIEVISLAPIMAVGVCIMMSCTTGSSISLEGNNLWILKSLPIDTINIFKSKIAVNLLVTLPIGILSGIILGIGFEVPLINIIWTIIIAVVISLFVAILGLVLNLLFPRLEWTSPTVVVKQSTASMLSIFIPIGVAFLIMGSFAVLKPTNINLFLLVIVGCISLLNLLGWQFLKSKGREIFKGL